MAWYLDFNDNKIEFESELSCCSSCVDEQDFGYYYGVSGCCCVHAAGPEKKKTCSDCGVILPCKQSEHREGCSQS